jgi:integrase
MVRALPAGLVGTRDRALLLLGFAGALRRSELVALEVADARLTREGLEVTIRRSKTDQEGEGQKVGIPRGEHKDTCPVRAYSAWLEEAGIPEGRVFRSVSRHGAINGTMSDRAVALVVKRAALRVGVEAGNLAGHSLRAGLVTAAAAAGVAERAIMNQTRHRSIAVMRSYIRDGSIFRDNAAAAVGL